MDGLSDSTSDSISDYKNLLPFLIDQQGELIWDWHDISRYNRQHHKHVTKMKGEWDLA